MQFQIVADESVDYRIVKGLRVAGFSVLSIIENSVSISDEEVLRTAVSNNALLITEDKDFGELVFRFNRNHTGILLLRLGSKDSVEISVKNISEYYEMLQNKYSVLTEHRLRIKD
ncbi:MAG TPA: DUF5615 family PIN-like protein [Cyclobacteriaceae bacterium]|nr:DUF5615 family PIN-like protein [Cyclobacteriaceae bacterium]